MTPETAVLLQRAAARRLILEGLLDSIPPDSWERQAPGDAWSARSHLAHLATIDELVLPIVRQASDGNPVLWLGGPEPGDLELKRTAALVSVAGASTAQLRAAMSATRETVARAVGSLPQHALERLVRMARTEDGWSVPAAWPLRTYLAGWAEHDGVHEEAIRRAMTAPPDFSTVALIRGRG
jgi:hypothetical protein